MALKIRSMESRRSGPDEVLVWLELEGCGDFATWRELRRLLEAAAPVELRAVAPGLELVGDPAMPPNRVDLRDPVSGRVVGRIEGLELVPRPSGGAGAAAGDFVERAGRMLERAGGSGDAT